jgi:hypothetical protein
MTNRYAVLGPGNPIDICETEHQVSGQKISHIDIQLGNFGFRISDRRLNLLMFNAEIRIPKSALV